MKKNDSLKNSVASRAVDKVKTAPQKLMEHTVDKALKTVEKAAVKKAVKKEKAAAKKEKKAEKIAVKEEKALVRRAVKAAKRDAKKTSPKKKEPVVKRIKQQIKGLLNTPKEERFFYSRPKLIYLALAYALISCVVWKLSVLIAACPCLLNPVTMAIWLLTMVLTLLAFASAVYVMIIKPTVAVVKSDTILIDRNAPLRWEDVAFAEEKRTLLHRPFIALHLKDGVDYPLTFMQKLCKNNTFTPFSLPLYAMEKEDASRLRELVKKYVDVKTTL